MSFVRPTLNRNASKRHARSARLGRPAPPDRSAQDSVDLVSHLASLTTWYRQELLPSPLGQLVQRGLERETDAVSTAIRTGDLGNLVELR